MVTDYKKSGLSPSPSPGHKAHKKTIGKVMEGYSAPPDPNRMPPGDPSISKLPAWKAAPIPKRDRPVTERPKDLPTVKFEDRRNWPHSTSGFQSPENYKTIQDPTNNSVTLLRKGSRYEKPFKDTKKAVARSARDNKLSPKSAKKVGEYVGADVVGDLVTAVAKQLPRPIRK